MLKDSTGIVSKIKNSGINFDKINNFGGISKAFDEINNFGNIGKRFEGVNKFGNISKQFDGVNKFLGMGNALNVSVNNKQTAEEALNKESNSPEVEFDIDDKTCEICSRPINHGCYVFQEGEEIHFICDKQCADVFQTKFDINQMELYKISRCVSYNECSELHNLRRMCEQQEWLTSDSIIQPLRFRNFCEPAQAGQIKASYAIFKHLQKVDEENEQLSKENLALSKKSQFLTIISTIMAGLTIILTIASFAKSCTEKPINYHDEIEKMQEIDKSILNEIQQTNDKIKGFETLHKKE